MGTGSVDDGLCSGDGLCRRCLSPFSGGDTGTPWKRGRRGKRGQAPSREEFLRVQNLFTLGASPPFPLPKTDFAFLLLGTHDALNRAANSRTIDIRAGSP